MKNEETKALWEELRMSHLCLQTPFLLYLVCCLCHLDVYMAQHINTGGSVRDSLDKI